MARIKVQQVTQSSKKQSLREIYATVCYYYPQYNLRQVEDMPNRDVHLLLRVAMTQEANKFYNFTQIAAAPHSKKQVNVKKLLEYFKKMAGK